MTSYQYAQRKKRRMKSATTCMLVLTLVLTLMACGVAFAGEVTSPPQASFCGAGGWVDVARWTAILLVILAIICLPVVPRGTKLPEDPTPNRKQEEVEMKITVDASEALRAIEEVRTKVAELQAAINNMSGKINHGQSTGS